MLFPVLAGLLPPWLGGLPSASQAAIHARGAEGLCCFVEWRPWEGEQQQERSRDREVHIQRGESCE